MNSYAAAVAHVTKGQTSSIKHHLRYLYIGETGTTFGTRLEKHNTEVEKVSSKVATIEGQEKLFFYEHYLSATSDKNQV